MDPQTVLSRRAQVEDFQRRHRSRLVTMIFSDIVGSTKLKQILGDRGAIDAIQRHHALVREILSRADEGEEISTAGDAFFIVFAKPSAAVKFSLSVQTGLRRLAEETGHRVFDRIGIHVGEVWVEATATEGKSKDLYGIQVDTCARVSSLGGADQILLTRFAFDSARQVLKGEDLENLAPLSWLNHGPYLMKGVEEPLDVCEVGETGKAALTRPADTEKAHRFISADSEPVLGWRPAVDQPVPGTSWVLEKKLGEGGFGEVWLGRDKVLKTRHVFKFCFKADRVRSLKREVTLFRVLKERVGAHPNIVGIEHTYFDEPPFYIVMQHVDASDLPAFCEASGGIECVPLAARMEIVAQAADALQAAHDSGVIHRDVKPTNILVSASREGGLRVHLTDFGIGQIVSEEALAGITRAGFTQTMMESASSQSGTHLYMAPELFAGKPASIRSDIYALGVVLYQLLTGDFARPVTTDWAKQITDPLLCEDLEKCFAGNPQERFAGAGQLADQLRSLESRRTALAKQQALAKAREQAAYRRGIMRTAAAAASVVAVIALLAIYAFQQARRAERAATQARENLSQSDFLQAVRSIDENRSHDALAQLTRSLSLNPRNDPALFRLTTLLLYHSFAIPVSGLKHGEAIYAAEFSRDGKWIVTASADRTARVWDAQSGQPLTEPLVHHDSVSSAQFSPDGRWVVTASEDNTARLWDTQSGAPLTEPLKHRGAVWSAQFSPDGKLVVTASADKTARVWDAQSGRPLTEPLVHDESVRSAQFSPDGKRVVTASKDKRARLWDTESGALLTEPLKHRGAVKSARFSPDGKWIVTASLDKTAQVWDAQSGAPLTDALVHDDFVTSAQFSPDGKWIVTASADKTARLWDAKTGTPLTAPLKHDHGVESAQFSADGKWIVTASRDQTARVWDAQSGKPLAAPLKHHGVVYSAQFSHDGRRIVTSSADGSGRIWDAQSGTALTEPLKHDGFVLSAQFSPDARRIVTASTDQTARISDAQTGKLLTGPVKHGGAVESAQFSPDGKWIVTVASDETARVWNAESGDPRTGPLKHDAQILSAQFSPDGKWVVTASADMTARVWGAQSGKPLTLPLKHDGFVYSAQFSPDGKSVVTASADKTARVWDTQSGNPLAEPLKHDEEVYAAEFSPDGKWIVTASEDDSARVWDAQSGKLLASPMSHDHTVNSAQFSPDGKWIVTASRDTTARVWDARTGKPLTEPMKHEDAVVSAQFSPDGKSIVTVARHARVWDIAPRGARPPEWLPRLAEATAGQHLNDRGVFEPLGEEPIRVLEEIRGQLSRAPADDDWAIWGRWFLADRSTRTISPFSKITVPEYIENRIKENKPASLDEAGRLAVGNAELLSRIANARAKLETQSPPPATP